MSDYVERRFDPSQTLPAIITDCRSTCWLIEADQTRLQDHLDRVYERGTVGDWKVIPLQGDTLFYGANYGRLGPESAAGSLSYDPAAGWMKYSELGAFGLVWPFDNGKPQWPRWDFAFCYARGEPGVASGRESLGWEKTLGRVRYRPASPERHKVDTLLWLAPGTEGKLRRLITITRLLNPLFRTRPISRITDQEIIDALLLPMGSDSTGWKEVMAPRDPALRPGEWVFPGVIVVIDHNDAETSLYKVNLLALVKSITLQTIHYKQFREVFDSGEACFRSIVFSDLVSWHPEAFSLDPAGAWRVRTRKDPMNAPYHSYLGIPALQKSLASFSLSHTLEVLPGKEPWRA